MAETLLNQQETKIDAVVDGKNQNARLKKIIGVILSVVMIALTVYVLNLQHQNSKAFEHSSDMVLASSVNQAANYRAYVQQYKETKVQLEETTRKLEDVKNQLDQVTAELSTTKSMLSQTQSMLTQAQDENAKLKQELQGLDFLRVTENVQDVGQLEAKIKNLKDQNVQVGAQLADLKNKLRAFEADFSNMEEGKSLIALFQNKIKLVNSRMRYLKQEAYFAKIASQKERDRVAAMNGNNGFFVRDGEVVRPSANKSFAIDVKIVQ